MGGERRRKRQRGEEQRSTMAEVFGGEVFAKCFTVQFIQDNCKRQMCPFALEEDISEKIGGRPKEIAEGGPSALQIEVKTKSQSERIREVKEILGEACCVREHATFNGRKALIYIHNNDLADMSSFMRRLQEHYPITVTTRATWIKTRQPTTIPLLLTFNTTELPEYLRITGEYSLTRVYPFTERPMQCKTCFKYGHTKNRCTSNVAVCGWCTGQHPTTECDRETTPAKCTNYQQPHASTAQERPTRQEEKKIMKVQQLRKITRRQAKDIIEVKSSDRFQVVEAEYEKFLQIEIDQEDVRKMCPFKLEKFLTSNCGIKREGIISERNCYIIKVTSAEQYKNIMKLTAICQIPCKVFDNSPALRIYNSTKGLVYITEYEVKNEESFKEGLFLCTGYDRYPLPVFVSSSHGLQLCARPRSGSTLEVPCRIHLLDVLRHTLCPVLYYCSFL